MSTTISDMSKFYQFCLLALITAVATVALLFPHSLQDRLAAGDLIPTALELPTLPEITPPSSARAWGETGATVLPFAAQIMAIRNPQGIPLDPTQKGYLRPLFGDLVDQVTIVYQAKLLDRWSQDGQETHIGTVNSAAQTYCDRIYIRAAYKPRQTNGLILLAHEMTHSQQCQQAGEISKFGKSYFQGYDRGGQTYENNPLEKSARAIEKKFARQLCNSINCPPRSGRYYANYRNWGIDLPVNL
ncbi:MAG: DUF4157 domain-containing protein [Chamaesiphon sp.]|nr:DUF4157 domain-containing protein [Chamaesiphon sp.]